MKQQYEHSSSVVRGTKNVMSQVAPLNQCFIDNFMRLNYNQTLYYANIWFWHHFECQVKRVIIFISNI